MARIPSRSVGMSGARAAGHSSSNSARSASSDALPMGSSALGTARAAAALAAPTGGGAGRSVGTASCGSNSSRSLDTASA
eukprot:8204296-Pyramimonas_sp.AAC.1